MAQMTDAEIRAFLLEGTRTAKLATVRADGRPHVVPVWFVLDGTALVFTTGLHTVKAANLHRDPRVALCVDDQAPLYSYVMVAGTATVTQDAPDMLEWATRIGARYMGTDQAEAFGRRNAVPSEALVRVVPTRIIAERDIAAWG